MISGWILFAALIFVNTAVYVMIQMYFEGHPAFTDGDHI
tara:strand:+ start:905 stop:1021 length:117 start_codon:yes stop_codon:yes gene_type:complete